MYRSFKGKADNSVQDEKEAKKKSRRWWTAGLPDWAVSCRLAVIVSRRPIEGRKLTPTCGVPQIIKY